MESELARVVDVLPGLIWSARPDGQVDFVNRGWSRYTGSELDEALGNGWQQCVHPGDLNDLRQHWKSILASGQPRDMRARLRRFDGEYRWFVLRVNPLSGASGEITKWYGTATDIHDESLLEGEKQLLGLIAAGTPVAQVLDALCELVQASVDGALCSIAPIDPRGAGACGTMLCRLAGAAPDVPKALLEASRERPLTPDFHPAALSATRGESVILADLAAETRWGAWRALALSHGIHSHWSLPIRCSDDEVGGVLSILFREPRSPGAAEHGLMARFTHLASIAIERARNEAALKQSQAFLSKGQRASSTGTLLWRVASDEIIWSEEVYRIYEFDPALPVTFDRLYSRMHPEDVPSHRELSKRRRLEATDFEHEHRLLMPDRSIKYVHLVAHAIQDEDGNPEYIGTVQDVTQRRLSDEALEKVRSELAHVARVATLGTLTASIAHEVNQPLAGIITNASTCLRMLATEPPNIDGARETARRTIRDGNRASDVIERLRALFGKKRVTAEEVDLNEAAREVLAMLLGELQRRSVVLHPDFADGLPPIRGDRVQLQQVILNLIMNAGDAMSEVVDRPRSMRVSTRREADGRIQLAVSDCGKGFDPLDADRLFEAFYTTKGNGMGIGLSVSQSIIEGHEGRLWAWLNEGPGATFAFSLPPSTRGHAAQLMDGDAGPGSSVERT